MVGHARTGRPRRPSVPRRYPSSVQITFLGQAGLFVESKGVSILCDPWFNPSFFGSWFPFPANDGIDPERIGHPTYLYVSHLHHDHFDPRYLRDHVDKDATVLLPAYPLDRSREGAPRPGIPSVHQERRPRTVPRPGPLTLTIHALVAPTDGPIGDSALVIDDGEVRVLNMNDSRPPDPDRLLAGGPLDAAFLQFSGRDLVPDGLRLPGQRPAGPRPQEAGRPAGPRVPLHRGPRSGVRRAVGGTAVLPR